MSQSLIEKQQDEVLTELSQSLDRLGHINQEIKTELIEQQADLDEVDTKIDEAQGSIQRNLRKIEKALKSRSVSGGIIGGLSLLGLGVLTYILLK